MFDLYHGQDQAAYRQAELLHEIAADRLARSARNDNQPSTDHGPSRAHRAIVRMTDAVSVVTGALHQSGRHPRGI